MAGEAATGAGAAASGALSAAALGLPWPVAVRTDGQPGCVTGAGRPVVATTTPALSVTFTAMPDRRPVGVAVHYRSFDRVMDVYAAGLTAGPGLPAVLAIGEGELARPGPRPLTAVYARPVDQPAPHTVSSLAADLRALGLAAGDLVLAHCAQRSIGFVAGGTHAVVQALLDVLGDDGTLVVPTHTPDNTDPADWRHPPVPPAWWRPIREQTPGFDPARTPSRWMGAVAEAVRTWPGALRSDHPQVSFAALGARAADVVRDHRLDDALGEHSPLGAVYRLDGKVLLLGCGHDSNTSLHLAEYRQPFPPRDRTGSSVRQPDGTSRWTTWIDVVTDEDDFTELGEAYEAAGGPRPGRVGNAAARLMPQRALVDFATTWLAAHRP